MDKFEYETTTQTFDGHDPNYQFQKKLDSWGSEGWELVHMERQPSSCGSGFSVFFVFKRKVTNE